eukprot:NODE_8205_length_528_cov_11.588727_g7150_i0.p2 GENE.NODE_8205_length_528_cov_11.588727_g7150_i0~~NODE_8205_length_528_cov_11.588727_g7150_i0.p2  ORF type:complete len:121 (+),score=36.35 NODE_8205_length_528_cov_11.588727_g7150_i0:82-444(+)
MTSYIARSAVQQAQKTMAPRPATSLDLGKSLGLGFAFWIGFVRGRNKTRPEDAEIAAYNAKVEREAKEKQAAIVGAQEFSRKQASVELPIKNAVFPAGAPTELNSLFITLMEDPAAKPKH